jgi:membrane-associated phospholipid phosphatase
MEKKVLPNQEVLPARRQVPTRWPTSRVAQAIRQAALLAGIMVGSLALYLLVLWWRGPSATIETLTDWDAWIPFHPEWVWVYLIPYVIGPVIVGLLSAETFRWYVRRGIPLVLVSLLIFILLPTKTVRPDISELGSGPTAELYRNMIAIDGPAANAAPSLHVSLTCLLVLALLRDYPRWWAVSITGVTVVWLSTLFTRQHHLIDVVSGVVFAVLFALPWPAFWPRAANRPSAMKRAGEGN